MAYVTLTFAKNDKMP